MKIITRHPRKKVIVTIVVALLVVAAGVVAYAIHTQQSTNAPQTASSSSIDYKPPTTEQTQTGSDAKSQTITEDESDQATPDPTTPAVPGTKQSVQMTAPFAQQVDDTVRITTDIATVTSSGTCSLVMVSSGKSYSPAAVGVQPLASSSTCKGYTIPVSLLASGAWAFSIMFENDTTTGSVTGNITVN